MRLLVSLPAFTVQGRLVVSKERAARSSTVAVAQFVAAWAKVLLYRFLRGC
jgi:hypothetical protein